MKKNTITLLKRIFDLQEKKYFEEVLNLTIKKASKRLNAVSKEYYYFSPKLLKLKEELEKCENEGEVFLNNLAKLQSRISKLKNNPEKLNLLKDEEMEQRNFIKAIIQDRINYINDIKEDLELKFKKYE